MYLPYLSLPKYVTFPLEFGERVQAIFSEDTTYRNGKVRYPSPLEALWRFQIAADSSPTNEQLSSCCSWIAVNGIVVELLSKDDSNLISCIQVLYTIYRAH